MANSRNSAPLRVDASPVDPGPAYWRAIAECEARHRARHSRSPRFGCAEPRIVTPPLRELTPETTAGFACVEFATEVLGIDLLPWQVALLLRALELLPDGTFRFRTVVVLVARQNGKSTLAQVLALFFMYVRAAALIIGTAQNLDIAKEVWQGAVDIAQDVPELAELIAGQPRTTNGQIELKLVSGERYKVQAASRRGGRGLSGDLVLLDELREHQTWDAWGAVTKTTLARELAQVWALSNAGDATSVVLRHLRKQAHKPLGDPDGINAEPVSSDDIMGAVEVLEDVAEIMAEASEGLGIFEWSAKPECSMGDRDQWGYANPSLGYTLTERALASALATDPEWVFRTECLCQWSEGTLEGPYPPGAWDAGIDAESEIPEGEPVSFGLDVSASRSAAHIGVVGRRGDGDWHGEIVASRIGIDWSVQWFRERASVETPMRVAVQGRGAPVTGLIEELEAIEGLTVVKMVGSDLGVACGRIWDAVASHVKSEGAGARLWHRPQPVLDIPAATAATKVAGDGAWMWDRLKSPSDSAPMVAITNALFDASRVEEVPTKSAYEDSDLLVV